jgi:hypothetical protein
MGIQGAVVFGARPERVYGLSASRPNPAIVIRSTTVTGTHDRYNVQVVLYPNLISDVNLTAA